MAIVTDTNGRGREWLVDGETGRPTYISPGLGEPSGIGMWVQNGTIYWFTGDATGRVLALHFGKDPLAGGIEVFDWPEIRQKAGIPAQEGVTSIYQTGDAVYFCSLSGITKYRPSDESVLWTFPLSDRSYSTCIASADDERAYVPHIVEQAVGNTTSTVAGPGLIALRDTAGGGVEVAWSRLLPGTPEGPLRFALVEGVLYFAAGRTVLAVDARNGATVWEATPNPAAQEVPSPVVMGDLVVATDTDGFVYGLDRGTGKVLWQVRLGEPIVVEETVDGQRQTTTSWPIGRPFSYEDIVFVGRYQGGLTALSRTGQILWSVNLEGPTLIGAVQSFAGHGEAIYVGTGYQKAPSDGGFLYKILLPQN